MILSYQSTNGVTVKTKNESIALGDGVRIGSMQIVSAGEYDVAGIQCEATYLDKATAYFLITEDLTITFLSDVDTSITKADGASRTDILVIDIRSDASQEHVKSIIKSLEPAYLLLFGAGATPDFIGGLNLPKAEGTQLKVAHGSLPLEGTHIFPPA